MNQSIFRAYDIRGIYPSDIDEDAAYRIARGYVQFLSQKSKVKSFRIALGKDVRSSSPSLWRAAAQGLLDEGVEVTDIGTISTDMLYFAVGKYGFDGGITISASHNPAEYNGMKMVREKAIPISSDTGLFEIRDLAVKVESGKWPNFAKASLGKQVESADKIRKLDLMRDYTRHNLSFVDGKKIKPFKVVINANFGMAGVAAREMVKLGKLPVKLVELNCKPDGTFPKGRPDPLIPANRHEMEVLIRESSADLGVAWDADADRCFFFDSQGEFVTPAFMTALMATHLIARSGKKGEKIINDTRIYWPIEDAVRAAGGQLILMKAGHTFIKERMRKEDALFAAETSAHYFYRDNFYTDNGMISFLLALEILSQKRQKLSAIIKDYKRKYAVSDEINFNVEDQDRVIASFRKKYAKGKLDDRDGLSINFSDWRFSLRTSNTEPLIRLNVETRGDYMLLRKKIEQLSQEIQDA